jgi:hypothetical protein
MINTVSVIDELKNTASYLPGEEMNTSYYLTAFIDEQGQRRPFSLKIEGPFATPENRDFYCRIESLELLGKDFNVYGDSKTQSKEQAFKFVEICLRDKKIYDAKGNTLTLDLRH